MKFLILLLFSLNLYAEVIEAPSLGIDFAQNPPEIEWRHITTEHFDIIFPAEIEKEAGRVGHLLERAYPFVTRSLEVDPKRIPLILQNQSVQSNGFVTLAPRRSEWYVTPAIDPELTNTEWLKTLAIHEFRHVVQFQKTRRGFNLFYEIILGEVGQALGLGLTAPPWFLEGDAVGIETALTKGGRGRLPVFERDLRTLLLSGKEWDYDKAHLGSYEDYVPNHYVYGYFYTSWLRNQYGDLFLSRLINQSAETTYNPLSFYNAYETLTHNSFESFYKSVMKDLISEWKNRADKIEPTPVDVKPAPGRHGWTNYLYPQATQDGRILALKKGLSFIDRFVLLDGKKEEVLFYPGILQNDFPYKLREGKFAFTEWELDPRWGYRDYGRLRVYDLQKKKFILDKRETKARLPALDHHGEKIVYIEWNETQGQYIVVLDKEGVELKRIPYRKEEVITSVDWLTDNEIVFVTKDHEDLKSIVKFNLDSQEETILLPDTVTNLGFLTVEDGKILYESPESGIDNIWTLEGTKERQLTSSLFGAYAPEIKEGKLLYNDYTVKGMNVVEKILPWQYEQASEKSFYPVFEKYAQSENFKGLESEFTKTKELSSTKYSQLKNAINLHSWVILAPPMSSTVSLIAYSKDVLNKFGLAVGTEYDLNEQTLEGFISATWSHLYPVFDLRLGYGSRRQNLELSNQTVDDKWEEGTLEVGVQVPWRYIQGRFIHSFTARAFSKLIQVTNKLNLDPTEISDGTLFSPGAEMSYSFLSRLARRDMNPPLGVSFSGKIEEGRDISGDDQRGSLQVIDGRLFLPGPWYHHSFYHQLAYERQRDDFYQYSSTVLYPRGTRSLFLQELTQYSANYLMPIFYPDWNLSRYIYFKRIALNLFYDELNGHYKTAHYHAASTGWETIFEMNFVRIFIPFSIGLRGSYILDGLEKDQNYEIFLASTLASF